MNSLPQIVSWINTFWTRLHVNPVCWAAGSRSQWVFASRDVCCREIHLQLQNDLLKVLLNEKPPLWISIIFHRQHFDVKGGGKPSVVNVLQLVVCWIFRETALFAFGISSFPALPSCYSFPLTWFSLLFHVTQFLHCCKKNNNNNNNPLWTRCISVSICSRQASLTLYLQPVSSCWLTYVSWQRWIVLFGGENVAVIYECSWSVCSGPRGHFKSIQFRTVLF